MGESSKHELKVEDLWRRYLTTGDFPNERRQRNFFKFLPGTPRCKNCYAPFQGAGSVFVKLFYGKQPSNMNPRLCNICERFASKHQGGADIELSLLFADVRGSTSMSEKMSSLDYSKLINRFYNTATQVLVRSDALIDKIVGDQVAGMYVPGFVGSKHARSSIEAALDILKATGHDHPEGPWIPLGVGVHTGNAFVGSVRSEEGISDITVLGDTANTAARLSSVARTGEVLISRAAYAASGLDYGELETRQLKLKGKTQPILVHVLPVVP